MMNIMKTSTSQAIQSDACQVLPCGNSENQRQLSQVDKYLRPEPGNGYHPCPSWGDVCGPRKGMDSKHGMGHPKLEALMG